MIYIILAVFAVISLVFSKKGGFREYMGIISFLAVGIVIYIQNRLLYNICLR